jgi:methylglutaconyl-CoA hydratase
MIIEDKDGYVKSATHQGIATIEFFHPQSNSLPAKILEDLAKEIHFAGTHNEVKVIVLKSGSGQAPIQKTGTFCAGASFTELMEIRNEAEGFLFFNGFASVINAMRRCKKLIIGRIHGKCVGGGLGLAAAVDYAIAVEGADIKLSELAVGIGPFVVGPAVERKMGAGAFSALAIDATMWRNSDWAKRKGLYAELHPDIASLDEAVHRLSGTLAHSSPEAMAEMKKMFWKGTENWDELLKERAAISGRLILSEFSKNAIQKFKAKGKG